MAITRTSQVDDDGSGTTGTIWNNAWKQELYNQIDANPAVQTYTPTWGATGTAPVMGPSNTLNGWVTTQGKVIHVHIHFVIQPGTTFGTGAWTYALPATLLPLTPLALGASLTMGGNVILATAGVYNSAFLVLYAPGAPNGVGGTVPAAWAAGDSLIITGAFLAQ